MPEAFKSKFKFPYSILNENDTTPVANANENKINILSTSFNNNNNNINNINNINNNNKHPISRVTRACDRCTHKKLRCDGVIVPDNSSNTSYTVMKACSRCVNSQATCEYTRTQKRRGPSPGFKRRKLSNESTISNQSSHNRVNSGGNGVLHSPSASSASSDHNIPSMSLTPQVFKLPSIANWFEGAKYTA